MQMLVSLGQKRKREQEESLSCPVCLEVMLPPVMQCSRGHAICSDCLEKIREPKKCPECRASMAHPSRNLRLEAASTNVTVPCKWSRHGCHGAVAYKDMADHLLKCPYRPFSCPCDGRGPTKCDWMGASLEAVETHIAEKHDEESYTLRRGGGGFSVRAAMRWDRAEDEDPLSQYSLGVTARCKAADDMFLLSMRLPKLDENMYFRFRTHVRPRPPTRGAARARTTLTRSPRNPQPRRGLGLTAHARSAGRCPPHVPPRRRGEEVVGVPQVHAGQAGGGVHLPRAELPHALGRRARLDSRPRPCGCGRRGAGCHRHLCVAPALPKCVCRSRAGDG